MVYQDAVTMHNNQHKASKVALEVRQLNAWYSSTQVLKDISMDIRRRQVTAVIGPSGCGKSTLVRCLNRMHETVRGARVQGQVFVDGLDIYDSPINPVQVRRRIGMVFQKPNPFPAMSIKDNIVSGLKMQGVRVRDEARVVEESLSQAALWDEVKDRLEESATGLSGGQQQRLCIARALALHPDIILMDEPCSALDPIATSRIEQLMHELAQQYTVVIVTHNMQQAARVADDTAFLFMGELIEFDATTRIFTKPGNRRTEDYITGRFG